MCVKCRPRLACAVRIGLSLTTLSAKFWLSWNENIMKAKCRPWLAYADCTGCSGTTLYAHALIPVFTEHGSSNRTCHSFVCLFVVRFFTDFSVFHDMHSRQGAHFTNSHLPWFVGLAVLTEHTLAKSNGLGV